MKLKTAIVLSGIVLFFAGPCLAGDTAADEKAIVNLIKESYVKAAHNQIDTELVKKGFHEKFNWQLMHHGRLFVWDLKQWFHILERDKLDLPVCRATYEFVYEGRSVRRFVDSLMDGVVEDERGDKIEPRNRGVNRAQIVGFWVPWSPDQFAQRHVLDALRHRRLPLRPSRRCLPARRRIRHRPAPMPPLP